MALPHNRASVALAVTCVSLTALRLGLTHSSSCGQDRIAIARVPVLFYPHRMPDRSLGYAAEKRMLVVATCKQCKRQARALARDLASVYGRHRDYRSIRFRCSQCDPGACDIHQVPDGWDRVPERIVWKPVVIKDRQ